MKNFKIPKSAVSLLLIAMLASFPLIAQSSEELLKESVTVFWKAQVSKDKVTAMQHVHPDDLNTFLNRKPAVIRSWELSDIEFLADQDEAKVKIRYSLETYPGTAFNLNTVDTWQVLNGVWKVRVKDSSAAAKKAFFGIIKPGSAASAASEKSLKIKPAGIKFYKTNLDQPAFIWIENGLAIPVKLLSAEVDQTLIKIIEQPDVVAPGERAQIKLQYIGGIREKENLATEVVLAIETAGNITRHTVPAMYNYMNAAMKWIQEKQQGSTPQPEE